jgi:hypothetical protein
MSFCANILLYFDKLSFAKTLDLDQFLDGAKRAVLASEFYDVLSSLWADTRQPFEFLNRCGIDVDAVWSGRRYLCLFDVLTPLRAYRRTQYDQHRNNGEFRGIFSSWAD